MTTPDFWRHAANWSRYTLFFPAVPQDVRNRLRSCSGPIPIDSKAWKKWPNNPGVWRDWGGRPPKPLWTSSWMIFWARSRGRAPSTDSTLERLFKACTAADADVGKCSACQTSRARLVPSASVSKIPANATGSGDEEHQRIGFLSETWTAAASSCSATRFTSNSPARIKHRRAEISCLAAKSWGATKPSAAFAFDGTGGKGTWAVASATWFCQNASALFDRSRAKGRAGTSPVPAGSNKLSISSTIPHLGPCHDRFCAKSATSWVFCREANIPSAASCSTSHPSSSGPMICCNKSMAASTLADASRKTPFQRSMLTVFTSHLASAANSSAWWGVSPSTVFNSPWQKSSKSKVDGVDRIDEYPSDLSRLWHSASNASTEIPEAASHKVAAVESAPAFRWTFWACAARRFLLGALSEFWQLWAMAALVAVVVVVSSLWFPFGCSGWTLDPLGGAPCTASTSILPVDISKGAGKEANLASQTPQCSNVSTKKKQGKYKWNLSQNLRTG